jgi:hypothetical protein
VRKEDSILTTLNMEKSFKSREFDRYCVSKLFDLYIAIELAGLVPRGKGSPVAVVNCNVWFLYQWTISAVW